MGQSPLEQKMDLGHSRKVQSEIFLNQGVYFEYTQLLPGVEMILLIPGAKGTPLMDSPIECHILSYLDIATFCQYI